MHAAAAEASQMQTSKAVTFLWFRVHALVEKLRAQNFLLKIRESFWIKKKSDIFNDTIHTHKSGIP